MPSCRPSKWGGSSLTLFIYATVVAFGMPVGILLALISEFVITFKETALVVIDVFDLMASGNAAYQTGVWSSTGAFTLSRYGAYVERRFGIVVR